MASFGNLYTYNVNGGVILADTSSIKTSVESAFKQIFGNDFSTEESTINGRLIESIVIFFKDVLGVNAQNVNALNIERAIGIYLDNLGNSFGVPRNGMSDNDYRKAIVASFSRGSGFASSISNAIFTAGASKCIVLDNGNEDPAVLPVDAGGKPLDHSILVSPHSVFISVLGGDSAMITKAIRSTKANGCGFEKSREYGTPVSQTIVEDRKSFTAYYYVPTQKFVKVSATVSSMAYQGLDIIADAKNAIKSLFDGNSINATITSQMLYAALVANGLGIVCIGSEFKTNDVDNDDTYQAVEKVAVEPFRFVNIQLSDIEIIVQ